MDEIHKAKISGSSSCTTYHGYHSKIWIERAIALDVRFIKRPVE
jgi:hypothetical protein